MVVLKRLILSVPKLVFISVYNQSCLGCQQKRTKAGNKKFVVKPLVSTGFMNRGQLDLDRQRTPDDIWKWIMHYQTLIRFLLNVQE